MINLESSLTRCVDLLAQLLLLLVPMTLVIAEECQARIVDAQTRRPIQGAKVHDPETQTIIALSDAEGEVVLPNPASLREVTVEAADHASIIFEFSTDSIKDGETLLLTIPGMYARIGVLCVDAVTPAEKTTAS